MTPSLFRHKQRSVKSGLNGLTFHSCIILTTEGLGHPQLVGVGNGMFSAYSKELSVGNWKPHVLSQPAGFQETEAKSSAEFPKTRVFLGN